MGQRLKGQLQGPCRASRAWRMRQVNTPRTRRAFVENFSDAPRAQDNVPKLLTTLSTIAAPSAGTLQNLCKFLVRVPVLGAAMTERAVNAVRETNHVNKSVVIAVSVVKG